MNIRVMNLSSEVTEQDLQEAFGDFGKVESITISNGKNGRKSLIALIDMPVEEEARKAIAYMDGVELKGQDLSVEDASLPEDEESLAAQYDEYEEDEEDDAPAKHTKRHNPDSERRY